jgi:hypothetical protein
VPIFKLLFTLDATGMLILCFVGSTAYRLLTVSCGDCRSKEFS